MLQWIQANALTVLALWAALNVIVLTPLAASFPPTSGFGKLVHSLQAISPLDVLKLWKTIGAAAIPPTAAVLLFLVPLLAPSAACTPAERAPIERSLSAALTDENLACLLATHIPGAPGDVHDAVVVGCGVGPMATSAALALLQLADKAHLGAHPDGGSAAVEAVHAAQAVLQAAVGDGGGP